MIESWSFERCHRGCFCKKLRGDEEIWPVPDADGVRRPDLLFERVIK